MSTAGAAKAKAGPRPADGALQPDKPQLREFFERTLRYVPDGSFYSFRSFHHDPKLPPWRITGVKLHLAEEGYDELVRLAAREAFYAANHDKPIVLAPPNAAFNHKKRTTEAHLACAPTLAIECDARPAWTCRQMQGLLGNATAIVRSGGIWADPETGEIEDKVHVYWRLREPALDAARFAQVKRARRLMAALVGSDTTAAPAVHPLRLPGSWHTKDRANPRLCVISGGDAEAETDLGEALDALEDAAALAGVDPDASPHTSNPDALADSDDDLMALAAAIPNVSPPNDASADEKARDRSTRRERWNRIGMAFWAASGGSDAGLMAFIAWSRERSDCSGKPDAAMARWAHYRTSPPSKLTVGTLIYEARKAFHEQGKVFRLPSWQRAKRDGAASADNLFTDASGAPGFEDGAAAGPFSDVATPEWQVELAAGIAELNGRYFVVTIGGRTVVASLVEDAGTERERLVFSREADIRLLYAHRHYLVGYTASGKEIWKGLGEAWLTDSRRRTYRRLDLITGGNCPSDVFNLWRGFGVVPRAGKWPRLEEHLLEVICDGDAASCAWLVGWIARAVQQPGEHGETAVVLRGKKGTGKGLFGQIMLRLFSSHSLHVTHSKHLVGHFNQHLVDALFLFADEAFWAGDKAGEGALKALITERMFHIEPKGIDSFQARNRLKILISSNEDWVIPVTADERRFFVLEVSAKRKGDRDYFRQLAEAIDGAELSAMLHDLLAMDLSGFDHRNPPHTTGLNRQKLVGADSLTKYWYDCLLHGEIIGTGESEWPGDAVAQVFHAAYVDYARSHGDHYPLSDAKMAEKLVELLPGKDLRRVRLNKAHGDTPRPTRYVLPPLEEVRKAFLTAMNIDASDYAWPVVEGGADA